MYCMMVQAVNKTMNFVHAISVTSRNGGYKCSTVKNSNKYAITEYMNHYQKIAAELLEETGITFNGDNPWDIQVYNQDFYKRALTEGILGFGESYMDGWWDSKQLDETLTRLFQAKIEQKVKKNVNHLLYLGSRKLFNYATKKRSFAVGKVHYDVGND